MNEQKTLRDEFAMAALSGLIQKQYHYPREASKMSYAIADAMLEARKKNGV